MAGPRVVLTYADYAALPADGRRYEIHDGELSVTPAPGTRHQRAIGRLFVVLHTFVTNEGRGEVFVAPTDVILSDTTIVQPDIVWVGPDRIGMISARGIEGPPTLAVEIVSPSTGAIDRHTKLQLYARHDIPWYWLVDPGAATLEVYGLVAGSNALRAQATGDTPLSAEPFPDLALPLASIFA